MPAEDTSGTGNKLDIRKQIFEAAKYITADWCPICEKEFTQADLDNPEAMFMVQYHKNSDGEWVEFWKHKRCYDFTEKILAGLYPDPPVRNTIETIACQRCAGSGLLGLNDCPRCKGTGHEPG